MNNNRQAAFHRVRKKFTRQQKTQVWPGLFAELAHSFLFRGFGCRGGGGQSRAGRWGNWTRFNDDAFGLLLLDVAFSHSILGLAEQFGVFLGCFSRLGLSLLGLGF